MKIRLLVFCALISFSLACTENPKKAIPDGTFIVSGTLDTLAGSFFYTYYKSGDSTISDSFKLAANKRFTAKGAITEPTLFFISLQRNGIIIPSMELDGKYAFWVEPGKQTNFRTEPNGRFSASGTRSQQEQNEFDRLHLNPNAYMAPVARKVAAAQKDGTFKNRSKEFEALSTKTFDCWQQDFYAFVAKHPKSFVSLRNLSINYGFPLDKAKAGDAFKGLSDSVKNSASAKALRKNAGLEGKLAIGATAPDFTEKNQAGKTIKLSSFRGRYVLVDFWASWCVPCRAENPNLKKAYAKYHSKGFDIFSVSLDENKTQWLKAVQQDRLPWPQVSELRGFDANSSTLYNITAIPSSFLLDKEGKIIARNLRGKELEERLKMLF